MKKFRVLIIILLLAAAGAGAWIYFFKKEEKPIVLQTEQPQYGYIARSVTATGTIEPVDTVTVGTQVSGTILKIYTDFNAKVRKGQLVAELDKSLFIAAVNQYKANLDVAKSSLVYEKSNFDRQTLLYNTGAIAKADYENAQNLYLTAKATVESVQAQLDAAVKNLDYASIYSPVDGVVMTRNISVGQTVAASFSTPTLFVIAKDISHMQVQAAVSEADIGDVRAGQRTTFTVDAYPDLTFTGTVNQIRLEPTVSANVVTYTTIITAPNEDYKLKPGMTANIFIYTKEIDSALLISAKALKFKPDETLTKKFIIEPSPDENKVRQNTQHGPSGAPVKPLHPHDTSSRRIDTASQESKTAFVWLKRGDTLIEKKVRTGLNDDTHVQILKGLSTDDEVVTGEEVQTKGSSAGSGTVRSPFMPARRPSNNAKPAAAQGQGGGGGRTP